MTSLQHIDRQRIAQTTNSEQALLQALTIYGVRRSTN